MKKKRDFIIFSNGPGEVSTWVAPIVEEIHKQRRIEDEYKTYLIIQPCQFGSGSEHFVAGNFSGIETVIQTRDYLRLLLRPKKSRDYGLKKQGVVLSLGGNVRHPVWFTKRVGAGYRLYGYSENSHFSGMESHYEKLFVRNDYVRNRYRERGMPAEKIEVVGDLVLSSIRSHKRREETRQELGVRDDEIVVVFMPGSRSFQVLYMLPVFLKVIGDVVEQVKNLKVFLLKSPYVDYELIQRALRMGGKIREAESIQGNLRRGETADEYFIEFSQNRVLGILEGGLERWGEGVDLAVTLPGTNTILLAYRRIPCLVVTPLNKPELIPIEGAGAFLKYIPFIGRPILRKAALMYARRFRFTALPNMYRKREIVPELFGVISTNDITTRVAEILKNKEHLSIKERLGLFYTEDNPARKIVRAIWGEQK